ncbi:isoprenoid biosynthesis glyoxalase ElbB [Crocinitomix catalasitica]|uniref:isoprenoid biosynthesis glyoxalase ElbB n=1 Tax=Crocinitomix catalasitica TaxID=184607 RepID=UPI00048127C2|nr:isoprenoid biosynthesis glyoxalase ElbB [Crocinitomix catalasitica]
MKIGLLLSGSGVYDGSEIQESVLAMLAIQEAGHEYVPISINQAQHHVINHLTGEEMDENRNMLIEAARIARGDIKEINTISPADIDAVVIPGGFGAAKNFTKWAFDGPQGAILPEVKLFLVNMVNVGKPICALCVSPVVLAKAFEDSDINLQMTLGSSKVSSPYDINGFHEGIKSVGATVAEATLSEITIDKTNNIVSAPCYMLDANIVEIRNNIKQAVEATIALC